MTSHGISTRNHTLLLLLAGMVFLISACSVTDQALNQGKYDQVIDELTQNPGKLTVRQTDQLKVAFEEANKRDLARIRELKLSGQPDIWSQVYFAYEKLDKRQQKIAGLPDDVREQIGFQPVDYSSFLHEAKNKAAAYYYALVEKGMLDGKIGTGIETYNYLRKIERIYPGFRDTEALIAAWEKAQPINVYAEIKNAYPRPLPPGIDGTLGNIDLSVYDNEQFRFLNQEIKVYPIDYDAEIIITDVKIKPEKSGEVSYTESVKIQDGVAYKLDEDGKFIYNSAGEKIEIPKFNTQVCFVTEHRQEKSILVTGKLQLRDNKSGKIIGTRNLKGESVFTNTWAKFKGDMDALSPETMKLVGSKKQDFPSDANMILNAGERLCGDATRKIENMLEKVEL